jgi:hypothetical protein
MNILPIGYPLGFMHPNEYTIERMGENPVLTEEELLLWTNLFIGEDFSQNDNVSVLVSKGTAITYDNYDALHKALNPLVAMRTGFGWVANHKVCVVYNEEIYSLTKIQHLIWNTSDGKKMLSEVFEIMNGFDYEETKNKEALCDAVIYLVKNSLLVLR